MLPICKTLVHKLMYKLFLAGAKFQPCIPIISKFIINMYLAIIFQEKFWYKQKHFYVQRLVCDHIKFIQLKQTLTHSHALAFHPSGNLKSPSQLCVKWKFEHLLHLTQVKITLLLYSKVQNNVWLNVPRNEWLICFCFSPPLLHTHLLSGCMYISSLHSVYAGEEGNCEKLNLLHDTSWFLGNEQKPPGELNNKVDNFPLLHLPCQ